MTNVAKYRPEQVEADNVAFFTSALATEMQSARFEHYLLEALRGSGAEPYRFTHFNYESSIVFDVSGLGTGASVADFRAAMARAAGRIKHAISGHLKSRVMMDEGEFELEFRVTQYWGGPDSNTLFHDPMSLRADDRLGRAIKVIISSRVR